jgi:predicted nucleotidyltransferase
VGVERQGAPALPRLADDGWEEIVRNKQHELKTWPALFAAVRCDAKRHELRVNDRGFFVCDILILREWDPKTEQYSGEIEVRMVTHVTYGGQFGLPRELCVMSLGPAPEDVEAEVRRRFNA